MLVAEDLQDEVRVGRDKTGELPAKSQPSTQASTPALLTSGHLLIAIGKVASNIQPRLLAKLHLHDALVPAYPHIVSLPLPISEYINVPLMTLPTPIGV